jgi:hypothetical protein
MVSSEQCQIVKHLRKKYLDRKQFKKNNAGKKMAPTNALKVSGPCNVMDQDLRKQF